MTDNLLDKEYENLKIICQKVREENGSIREGMIYAYEIRRQIAKIFSMGGRMDKVQNIINRYNNGFSKD